MIATLLLGIISVLFAYLAQYRNFQGGLKVAYTLIFLFLALRFNFGNDYKAYLEAFYSVNYYGKVDIFDETNQFEPAWTLLNRLFKPFGFFAMTAVLAAFHSFVFYRFIKKYLPVKYYWIAVFLYVFSPGFLLVMSTAMRQSVAITLFIFSIDYIFSKNALKYYLCIALASLFHTSAIVLIPVYFLGFVNWRIKWISGIIIISFFTSILFFRSYITSRVNQFIINYIPDYGIYEGGAELGSGLGFAYTLLLFIMVLIYDRFQTKETALIFKLSIISFLILPLGFIIQLIGRVGMYFSPATLIVYSAIYSNLKKSSYKLVFIVLLIFITLYSFFQFFNSDIYKVAFGTYHTIFSADVIY
jgi:hypothetical protein